MDVLIQFVGAVLITIGVFLISVPAGLITVGVLTVIAGTLNEMEKDDGTREFVPSDDSARNS